jgi:hypothetical protein
MSPRTAFALVGFLAHAGLAGSPAQAASPDCATAGGTLVQFPSPGPVWELCLLTPGQSSGTNGSGIEIREAFYNGHKVFKRAHVPILNVKYTSGAPCACYRDWFDEERKFEVRDSSGSIVNMSGTQNIFDNASSVRTVCDAGGSGGDIPPSTGFSGVAIERFPDHMVLTSQTEAGWYRYETKWTFFTDGRVHPQTGYAAVPSSCVSNNHHHNSYFRLDFDIDGAVQDAIGEAGSNQALTESGTRRPAEPAGAPPLKVYDKITNRGYHVIPHAKLGGSYDPFGGPAGAPWNGSFTIGDAWLLQYKSGGSPTTAELDDGQSCCGTGACPIGNTFLGWSNNESVDGKDVVVWYHDGAVHKGGQLDACARSGPTLEPFGDWSP